MKAYFKETGIGAAIEVEGIRKDKLSIYDAITEHCCKKFSLRELWEINMQLSAEMSKLAPEDVIPQNAELLAELKTIIKQRESGLPMPNPFDILPSDLPIEEQEPR